MKTASTLVVVTGCLSLLGILPGCLSSQKPYHLDQNSRIRNQTLSSSSTQSPIKLPAAKGAEKFVVTDLGTLGGKRIHPHAINNLTQIVGEAETSENVFHAFLWQKGQITDLGGYPDDFSTVPHASPIWVSSPAASSAASISNKSQAVGESESTSGGFEYHAMIWDQGQIGDLGTVLYGDSSATKINDQGQVVGSDIEEDDLPLTREYYSKPFLSQNNQLKLLPFMPESASINNKGEIVGVPLGAPHSLVIQANGKQKRLAGLVLTKRVFRTVINDKEQVIVVETDYPDESPDGYSMFPAYSTFWQHGKVVKLSGLKSYPIAEAEDLNNHGDIVGWVRQKHTEQYPVPGEAVLWHRGVLTDLNREIDKKLGWQLQEAAAINDKGEITGSGQLNGAEHAFLLTPAP